MSATGKEATALDLASGRSRTFGHLKVILVGVMVADLLTLVLTALMAWQLRFTIDIWSEAAEPSGGWVLSGPYIALAWLVVLGAQGAYAVRTFGAGTEEFRAIALASLITAGLVGMFCYLLKIPLSRGFVLLTFFLGTPLLLLERYAVRKVLHKIRVNGRLLHRVVAVGGPSGIAEVVDVLKRERYVGYTVVGACLPPGVSFDDESLPVPVLGGTSDLRPTCVQAGADTVLVARGGYNSSVELRRIAWELEGSDIDLVVVPSLTDIAGPRVTMRPVAGLPLLHVGEPQATAAGGLPKRVFDVLGALTAVVLLSPVMILVALGIKLEDGGPLLYRQTRVGRGGQRFACLKFRSMVLDAEELEKALREADEHKGALWKSKTDPRVTRVGRLIRRFSMDELPQLFNVVAGHMSLVGPRPQQDWEVEGYNDDVRRRLLVRPGMTGLWQVSGRSDLPWEEAVRLDLYYVDNWSMITDLIIMSKTVKAVVSSAGAY